MSKMSMREQLLGLLTKYREFAALSGQLITLELQQTVVRIIVLLMVVFVAGWFGVGTVICSVAGAVAYFVFASADIAKGLFIAAGVQLVCVVIAALSAWRLARKVDLPLTRRHVLQAFAAPQP
jgi:energy-coupling factor transporter transmembrane protein EcfT